MTVEERRERRRLKDHERYMRNREEYKRKQREYYRTHTEQCIAAVKRCYYRNIRKKLGITVVGDTYRNNVVKFAKSICHD
jgi:hypothetical protein